LSVFLDIPEREWVCANSHAFAVRDQFPVTSGHTLVITRRVVADWFAASEEERAAVFDLIDEVKRRLDAELHPDGYNVGFNAGTAAGQTVMHLHVHVIPRFRGDMDDPRGGVRHVIPSKGNYLRDAQPLATGGDDDPFARHVLPLFERAHEIAIVAAFVQSSGLERIETATQAALLRGAHVRVVTGDYLNITQADALETLLDWEHASEDDEAGPSGRFEARVIEVIPPAVQSFHPKSWRFESPTFGTAFVGSSNLSRPALERGIEWNLRVERDRDAVAYERIKDSFERLWGRARRLDSEWIADYARRARRVQLPAAIGEQDAEYLEPPPFPHKVQLEALAALRACRTSGRKRAIVVLATGLGKTWLAAFDFAQLAETIGRTPRVLFVAHRSELLKQAAKTYRRQLHVMQETARVGWFFGDTSELSADLVFASVAKLSRPDHLSRLAHEHFDYVVIDEVHHAAADSYRKILERIEPTFLLGLTATPDRADTADILGLFDDNIAYRADIARGIELNRLAPFRYLGVRDEIDYENIPWRNKRFDPELLAAAAQTDARMETMWRAWKEHAGSRTLVFCCSIAHADFVRRWLSEKGVRVAAVYAGDGSDDRELSLLRLEAGELDAVCAVDVFNEGVDVPSIDRVVMLRPTESSVIFLQQLGRGLRAAPGKVAVNVIDFVGNHRMFLERLRALLSVGGETSGSALRTLLASTQLVELPAGCSVDIELEAKELLSKLFRVSGADEVERAYRELAIERGADDDLSLRPTAGELQRMGYLPSRLRERHGSWFDFVRGEQGLTEDEQRAFEAVGAFLRDIETTEMTKCFKMVTLEVLIERDALASGLQVSELAMRAHAFLRRSPELLADVPEQMRAVPEGESAESRWLDYWKKNPVAAWTTKKREGRVWFRVERGRLWLDVNVDRTLEVPLRKLTRELVDYRLAQYRDRKQQAHPTHEGFVCKVLSNQRDPILKLPPRGAVALPEGETDIRMPDGGVWQFRFAKESCIVARPAGTPTNQLPDLLRGWFGPRAGQPGTAFQVRFHAAPDGLWIEPVQAAVIDIATRRQVVAYPDLRAAAGHVSDSVESAPEDLVSLPLAEATPDLFAVRVAGTSMDGGKQPLHDGDWAVMRLARSMPASSLEGRVVLVQVEGGSFGAQYQIKRLKRDGNGWRLTSDNPDGPTFTATEAMTPIAKLARVVRPDDLAPTIGTTLRNEEVEARFGFEVSALRTDRHAGHLFVFIDQKGVLVAPDRLRLPSLEARPAETGFVLARREDGTWKYVGVARQTEERGVWSLPDVDFATWRMWGEGREVSRRLPEGALARAELAIKALLELPDSQRWIVRGDGRRARILGPAQRGGIRIDGGEGGFSERTISVTDVAWVVMAVEDAAEHRAMLDEERVNRLRYLEGTPKGSTRWIDTGWAIATWNAAKSFVRNPIAADTAVRKVRDATGRVIDASFSVERVGDVQTIIFESRGGTKGSKSERNVDYAVGLELLLERLKTAGLRVIDVLVESRDTDKLSTADRRVVLKDTPYPVTIVDSAALRRKISAGQALVGRAKGAKGGGNQNKRLRIFVEGTSLGSLAELGEKLERGSTKPSESQ
jgi:superfamily II DNA or RNA helicase/diadenosine tetraphosphate (Ap4A) HIT family hydrolase/SOS-response transcriptional repressor LexA